MHEKASEIIKILLIEDNPGDARFIQELLKEEPQRKFEMIVVDHLKKSLSVLGEKEIDIILLDLTLLDSSGIESFRKISGYAPEIPVVVLTVLSDRQLAMQTVQEGAQDYLFKKDMNPSMLSRVIRYSIERNRLKLANEQLVNLVVHQLKTPLSIVHESLSQILDGLYGAVPEEQKKFLEMSLANIRRLNHLINNLLSLAKIGIGKFEVERHSFDLAALGHQIAEGFQLQIQQKNIELKERYSPSQIMIDADQEKISQVLLNLLGNALKFTEKGYIELSMTDQGSEVECVVADTGEGIEKEDLEKIFIKFAKLHRKTKSSQANKGSGLGLSIVKSIVELHGGQIRAESRPGEGTKMIFTLPKK